MVEDSSDDSDDTDSLDGATTDQSLSDKVAPPQPDVALQPEPVATTSPAPSRLSPTCIVAGVPDRSSREYGLYQSVCNVADAPAPQIHAIPRECIDVPWTRLQVSSSAFRGRCASLVSLTGHDVSLSPMGRPFRSLPTFAIWFLLRPVTLASPRRYCCLAFVCCPTLCINRHTTSQSCAWTPSASAPTTQSSASHSCASGSSSRNTSPRRRSRKRLTSTRTRCDHAVWPSSSLQRARDKADIFYISIIHDARERALESLEVPVFDSAVDLTAT